MDHLDPSPIAWASRLRLLDIVLNIPFGQQLRGDFRRVPGPGLTLSPGRFSLKVPRTLPLQRLAEETSLAGYKLQGLIDVSAGTNH